MVVNHERNPTPIGRRAEQMPGVRREFHEALGRQPTRAELATQLNVTEAAIVEIEAAEKQPYRNGGFRIYDISAPSKPKLIHHQLTGGIGVHDPLVAIDDDQRAGERIDKAREKRIAETRICGRARGPCTGGPRGNGFGGRCRLFFPAIVHAA